MINYLWNRYFRQPAGTVTGALLVRTQEGNELTVEFGRGVCTAVALRQVKDLLEPVAERIGYPEGGWPRES